MCGAADWLIAFPSAWVSANLHHCATLMYQTEFVFMDLCCFYFSFHSLIGCLVSVNHASAALLAEVEFFFFLLCFCSPTCCRIKKGCTCTDERQREETLAAPCRINKFRIIALDTCWRVKRACWGSGSELSRAARCRAAHKPQLLFLSSLLLFHLLLLPLPSYPPLCPGPLHPSFAYSHPIPLPLSLPTPLRSPHTPLPSTPRFSSILLPSSASSYLSSSSYSSQPQLIGCSPLLLLLFFHCLFFLLHLLPWLLGGPVEGMVFSRDHYGCGTDERLSEAKWRHQFCA